MINQREDYKLIKLLWDGLVVSMSASHGVGHRSVPNPGNTKDHRKNGTYCPAAWHTGVRVGV